MKDEIAVTPSGQMTVTRRDPFTGKYNTMQMTGSIDQVERYMKGELVQVAFPHLTPDQREFILTGITPESWDKHIKDE